MVAVLIVEVDVADIRAGWPCSKRARIPGGSSSAHSHAHSGGALHYSEDGVTAAEARGAVCGSSIITRDIGS